jgi:hypothetical protein
MAQADPSASTSAPVQSPSQPATGAAQQVTPSTIELSDDSLVKLPGSEKPVKYGEWFRGFQAKHTTVAQERARLAKEYAEIKAAREQELAELNRFREAAGRREEPKPPSVAEKLKELPYLKGQEAAEALSQLEGRFSQYDQALQVRDQAIKFLAQHLADAKKALTGISSEKAEQLRKAKIREVMKSLEMPDEAEDVALDLYHSYEGEELDDRFPELLKDRWDSIQKLVRAMDKKRVAAARRAPFVPTKGGEARPGHPGLDLSKASAKESAEALWEMVQNGGAEA